MKERLSEIFGLGPKKSPELAPEKPAPEETPDLQIEIGNSPYLFSTEAQEYLEIGMRSGYEKSKSILFVAEPHYSTNAQFSLYKGLELFFRDNPALVSKTTFLAEGFPAGQPISVRPLIEAEPEPSEGLIREVLSTFLIPGYMAYEWKYQKNIPIVGTEDPILYQLSSRLWPALAEETQPLWGLSIVARNKSIAQTLIEKSRTFENPILFAGDGHLDLMRIIISQKRSIRKVGFLEEKGDFLLEKLSLQYLKRMWKRSQVISLLSPDEAQALRKCETLSISNYLEKERIGYTALYPRGEMSMREEEIYKSLFRAQQSGDYREYIEELISERSFGTSGRPSPKAAAEFVKAYKKLPPRNPEAEAMADRGRSLEAKGKFIEAAEEFSAASAADPKVKGYLYSIQPPLIREVESIIMRVIKKPEKRFRIKPGVKPDLPVYGPYIEKDHHQRVSQFDKIFGKIPGKQEVIDNAMHHHWETKFGGILQIKGGQQLEPENVRIFEERHHLKEKGPKGGERVIKIDIATKDDIAVECKNLTPRPTGEDEIYKWIDQAATRFEPDIKGYKYKGVIIVVPDNRNLQDIESVANNYTRLSYPKLSGKIKICQVSQLKETYSLIQGK